MGEFESMSPDDFYTRFLDGLLPQAAAVRDVDALIRMAELRDQALPGASSPRIAGRVVGRIAGGRIVPMSADDAGAP